MKDFFLVFAVLHSVIQEIAGTEGLGSHGPIVGVVGQDLLLPCYHKSNTSAEVTEVVWLIRNDVVHHYGTPPHSQLPEYQGRTSLNIKEVQGGNLSLKLTKARLSDTNTYRCLIKSQTRQNESKVSVIVEAVGSTPTISIESLRDGRVALECQSTGWSSVPKLEWLDGKGRIFPAESTWNQTDAGAYRVMKRVTVKESDGSRFLCRVSSLRQTKKVEVEVQGSLFGHVRHHYWQIPPWLMIFLLIVSFVCIAMWTGHFSNTHQTSENYIEKENDGANGNMSHPSQFEPPITGSWV